MNHEQAESLIPAFALGILESEEQAQVAAHLRRCRSCRTVWADYQFLADGLLYAIPRSRASSYLVVHLRQQLSLATPRPRDEHRGEQRDRLGWQRLRLAGWITLMASIVLLWIANLYWMVRAERAEQQLALQFMALQVLAEAPKAVFRGDVTALEARAVLYFRSENRVAVLHGYGFPTLAKGQVYQVWLIRDGRWESGGLFHVNEKGEGTALVISQHPLGEYEAIGVTAEPLGGSPGPTSPRILGGKLSLKSSLAP